MKPAREWFRTISNDWKLRGPYFPIIGSSLETQERARMFLKANYPRFAAARRGPKISVTRKIAVLTSTIAAPLAMLK